MHYKNTTLSVLFLAMVLVSSCTNEQVLNDVTESSYATINSGEQNPASFLGKLPSDGEWATLSTSGTNDWRAFDDFYKNRLPLDSEKHYFNNLQWTCIAQMVKYTNFTEASATEEKQYYLDQIFGRNYVNEPAVVAKLLSNVSQITDEKEVALMARKVFELNKEHLSPENWIKHQQTHNTAYRELSALGYTRWGEPK